MSDHESIHVLIVRVMESIGVIGKDRTNQQQGWKFRGIEDAMNAVQPALVKHGVHYMPEVLELDVERYESTRGAHMKGVTVKVAFTFFGPAGDSCRAVTYGEASDAGDKAVSKAQSVALRVALLHALCIPTETESDPDHESHERGTFARSTPRAASAAGPTCALCGESLTGVPVVKQPDGFVHKGECP